MQKYSPSLADDHNFYSCPILFPTKPNTSFNMNPEDQNINSGIAYTKGQSISLLSRSDRPDNNLVVVIIECIRVGKGIPSQTVIVRVSNSNDSENTTRFAKFYDPSFFTPDPNTFEGSAGEYMKTAHAKKVESYERMKKFQGISVPRFFGDYQHMKENGESVDVILLENVPVRSLDKFRPPKNEMELLQTQCETALCHVHSCGVVHNDICAENILWNRDDGRVIICDFANATTRDVFEGASHVLEYYISIDDGYLSWTLKNMYTDVIQ